MRSVAQILQSLTTGSKNRLRHFRSNLKRSYDRRNFDSEVCALLTQFVRPNKKSDVSSTIKYLRNLRSSEDGCLFSQGVKDYSKLLQNGQRFAEANHTYFGWNRNYKAAKEKLLKEFRRLHLKPIRYQSDDDIVETLPKLDTHAGFTYIITGIKEKGKNLGDILSRWKKELSEALANGTFAKPILPAVRTQGSGHAFEEDGTRTNDCSHKTRMVSMIDLFVIITELIFAKPIQAYMATVSWYAGGKDLNSGVARIITGMRTRYPYWVSLDYSAFDQSVSSWLIHDAFEIIASAFDLTPWDAKVLKLIEHDFIVKDFVFGDEVIHSEKGVPSGSMFTQIVDSIVNRLVILTYLEASGNQGEMTLMGDDNLAYTRDKIDVQLLASYVEKNFGMKINSEKTKSGTSADHPTFLSCYWWPEGRYREPHEVIGKLLYPERKRNYGRDHGKPEETLWSYVLMYPITMYGLIDVQSLLREYPNLTRLDLRNMDSRNLPGFLRYVSTYSGGYWSNPRKATSRRTAA